MDKKKALEKAVCERFVKGEYVIPPIERKYELKVHSDAPDFILKDDKGSEIGLEVTTAYYDQSRAEGTWKRPSEKGIFDSRGNFLGSWNPVKAGFYDRDGNRVKLPINDVITEPDKCLTSFVQNQINEKCKKNYGIPCILVIYAAAPLWDNETLEEIRNIIQVPEKNPFLEIYIHVHVPCGGSMSPEYEYEGKFVFWRIWPYIKRTV